MNISLKRVEDSTNVQIASITFWQAELLMKRFALLLGAKFRTRATVIEVLHYGHFDGVAWFAIILENPNAESILLAHSFFKIIVSFF